MNRKGMVNGMDAVVTRRPRGKIIYTWSNV